MTTQSTSFKTFILSLTLALAAITWLSAATAVAEETKSKPAAGTPADAAASSTAKPAKDAGASPMPPMIHMNHITTQAQAEALKPGDAMSMTCSKCKVVTVQKVTADNAHVKMMTVGEKVTCPACGGTVEVVATGKGEGKNAEVKHVCSICGDDAMFCTATTPGSGSMKDMKDMDKGAKPAMTEEEMKKMKK